MTTTISAEAGLLQAAEQIAEATAEIATLIAAVEAGITLTESLGFDPGQEVRDAITALAESAPSPDALRAFGEMAPALVEAVKAQSVALIGS